MFTAAAISRAPRLSDEVARQLGAAIRDGEFGPGEKLPSEKELSDRFHVSRMVIREAMSRLKSDGLLETRQGLGAFVTAEPGKGLFRLDAEPDAATDLRSLFQLRVAVEVTAAGLAAANITPPELRSMRAALDDLAADIAAGRDGIEADNRFHAAIAGAANNPYFDSFIGFLGANLRGAIARARSNTASQHPARVRVVQAEHEAIYAAIKARHVAGAEAAMRNHLSSAMERLGLGAFASQACSADAAAKTGRKPASRTTRSKNKQ